MEFSRPESWSGWPFPSPGDLPNPGIKPRSPILQAESLPAEPQEKPKNPGVGSLSLLQWIFLTQESNMCLLHHRQILYWLSHHGSPAHPVWYSNWHLVITQDPWSRTWQPIPVFLPGKFPWTEEPGMYSSWGCKESGTTD